MRKSILFGIALLSLGALSCTREQEAPVAAPKDGRVVTLGASIADSKAAIDGEGAFTWQEGDALAIATSEGLATFVLSSGAGQASAEFSATLPEGAELGSSAVYPAVIAPDLTMEEISIYLPAGYDYEKDNTNVPLLGTVSGTKVSMSYIGGVVRLPLTDIPEGADVVVLSADAPIAGPCELGDTGIKAGSADFTSVAFDISEAAATSLVLNFPVPVGEFKFSIAVYDVTGNVLYQKESSAAKTIEAGTLLAYNELNLGATAVASMNYKNYATIAEAIAAAQELTSGEAVITLLADTAEEVYIAGQFAHGEGQSLDREIAEDEDVVTVPVVIDGNGKTLTGSIEIVSAPVTVKNLTIVPQAHHPAYAAARNGSYAFGIYLHYAKYGVVVDNVTIDMAEAEADATAIFMFNGLADQDDDGPTRDIVKNSVIKGNPTTGNRLLQLYQGKADFINNKWENAYSGYAVRVTGWGYNVLFENNSFKSVGTTKAVIDFRGGSPQLATLVLIDNIFGDDFTYLGYAAEDITAATYPNSFMPPVEYVEGGEIKFKEGLAWAKIYEKNRGSAYFPDVKYSTHFVAFSGTDIVTLDGVVSDLNGNKKGELNMEGVMSDGAIVSVTNDFKGVLSIAVIGPKDGVTTPPATSGEFGNVWEVWTYFDGWDKAPLKIWDGTSGFSVQSMSVGGDMLDDFVLLGKNATHNWHRVGSVDGANAKARVGNWAWFKPGYTFSDASYEQFVSSADGQLEGWYMIADADPGTFRFYARKGNKEGTENDVELVPTHERNYTRGNGKGFTFAGKPYMGMMSTTWGAAYLTIASPEGGYLMESQIISIPQAYCSLAYMYDEANLVGHVVAMAITSNPEVGNGAALVRYDLYPDKTELGGNVVGPEVTVTPGGKF